MCEAVEPKVPALQWKKKGKHYCKQQSLDKCQDLSKTRPWSPLSGSHIEIYTRPCDSGPQCMVGLNSPENECIGFHQARARFAGLGYLPVLHVSGPTMLPYKSFTQGRFSKILSPYYVKYVDM